MNKSATISISTNISKILPLPPLIIPDVYHVCLGITILISNGLLMYLIITRRQLWKRDHIRLMCMCITAIIMAVFYYLPYPWIVKNKKTFMHHLQNAKRDFLIASFNYLLTLHLIDKTIIIAYPLKFHHVVKTSTTWISTIVVWILSLVVAFFPVLTFRQYNIDNPTSNYVNCEVFANCIYYLVFYTVFFVIPAIIICCCQIYLCVIRFRHLRKIQSLTVTATEAEKQRAYASINKKRFKAVKSLILITGIFMVFTFPYYICLLIHVSLQIKSKLESRSQHKPLSTQIAIITNIIKAGLREAAFSYPALNPVVFICFSLDLRQVMKEFLTRSKRSLTLGET